MLFNSYEFVFAFFPLALAGVCFCRRMERRTGKRNLTEAFALVVSLLFYAFRSPEYLPVLLVSMAVNYGLFCLMEREAAKTGARKERFADRRRNRKRLLAAGIVFDLGLLFLFKYTDTGGFVPPGISFFTFTQIAFLVEGYRGNTGQTGALDYGLYVSFFPKIMQGPIALPGETLPQFEGGRALEGVCWEHLYRGLYLFVLGLAKKVLIADTLGKAADFGYANMAALNSGDALIVMLSYTLQLYFDFSGYCDMAMGIGWMLGVDLPLNFDSPYKASNIMEFWERWHMTLTGFFTRYLYIPLGGNRRGRGRTYANCLIVFLVSGIWHGAGATFVVWGLMHGLLYVITRAFRDVRRPLAGEGRGEEGTGRILRLKTNITHVFHVLLTFISVNLAWIFFRAPSLGEAVELIRTIFRFSFGRINWELAGCFNLDEFWYVIKVLGVDGWQYAHYILPAAGLILTLFMVFFGKTAESLARRVKPGAVSAFQAAVLFVWSVLSFSEVSSFLYVNF